MLMNSKQHNLFNLLRDLEERRVDTRKHSRVVRLTSLKLIAKFQSELRDAIRAYAPDYGGNVKTQQEECLIILNFTKNL